MTNSKKSLFSILLLSSVIMVACTPTENSDLDDDCDHSESSQDNDLNHDEDCTGLSPTTSARLVSGPIDSIDVDNNRMTVNGITISLSDSDIQYSDETLDQDSLHEGMEVNVFTQSDHNHDVQINPDLLGIIKNIDDVWSVNGINLVLSDALIEKMQINNIVEGDWVFINGVTDTNNSFIVGMLDKYKSGYQSKSLSEIEGMVSNLSKETKNFTLLGKQIDYNQANYNDSTLTDGMWVEVRGEFVEGIFLANHLKIDDMDRYSNDYQEMEIYGNITWVNSTNTRFELNNNSALQFDMDEFTRFERGALANFVVGEYVEVSAVQIMGQTGFTAEKVEFKTGYGRNRGDSNDDYSDDSTDHTSDSLDDGRSYGNYGTKTREFELSGVASYEKGELIVNGYTFILSNTRLKDGLSLNTLNGQPIDIEGVYQADQLFAYEIERQDSSRAEFKGIMENGQLWGYSVGDNSLSNYTDGQWVDVKCQFNNSIMNNCRWDD